MLELFEQILKEIEITIYINNLLKIKFNRDGAKK